jgi:hypothetical protein
MERVFAKEIGRIFPFKKGEMGYLCPDYDGFF